MHWRSFEPTYQDVIRWKSTGRFDILKHIAIDSDDQTGKSYVFVPNSCPFLRNDKEQSTYYCAINDTKPFYCRNYPDDDVCEYTNDF